MKTYTAQEVFDKVATHLLTQNKRSQSFEWDSYVCAYRGDNGLQCAAGCMIRDEDYDKGMEDIKIEKVIQNYPNLQEYLGEHIELLKALQTIHDHWPASEWLQRLKTNAFDFNLKSDVVDNFTGAKNGQ